MKRVFVDFGRRIGDDVPLLLTSRANVGVTVEEGEHVLLYDGDLEVEGVAHYGPNVIGVPSWSAIADWATQRDAGATLHDIAAPAQP